MPKEKTIENFIKWLELKDRQNWEIERYVEDILRQKQLEMLKKR